MNKDEDFLNEYLSEIYFKEQNGIIIGSVFCFIFGFGAMLSSCTKEGDVSHFFMGFLLATFGGILWGINSSTIDDKTKKKKKLLLEAKAIIDNHFDVLYTKYSQLRYQDEYGIWHNEKWNKELDYFFRNVFSEDIRLKLYYGSFFNAYFYSKIKQEMEKDVISQEVRELKTGDDFEEFIKAILQHKGLNVRKTPRTGDQGVDLIVKTDTSKIAIQCKFYSKPVGNKAVQEVAAGKVFYKCDQAIVVSNQPYTISAKKLAQNLNVLLLNEKTLLSYLNKNKALIEENNDTNRIIGNNIVKEYYPNGNIKMEGLQKDGKLNGPSKFYDENGNLRAEGNLKDGKPEGLAKDYDENGNLRAEENFKDGKREGVTKYYHENGKLHAEINFKNNKQEGLAKFYDENGKLHAEINFKNNKLEGLAKFYHENGKLHAEINLKDGEPISGYLYDIDGKQKKMTNAHLYNLTKDFEILSEYCHFIK